MNHGKVWKKADETATSYQTLEVVTAPQFSRKLIYRMDHASSNFVSWLPGMVYNRKNPVPILWGRVTAFICSFGTTRSALLKENSVTANTEHVVEEHSSHSSEL